MERFERTPQPVAGEEIKERFLSALDKELLVLVDAERISVEEAAAKKERGALIETGLSDNPEHDAKVFAISGIGNEEELIELFKQGGDAK